MPSSARRKIAVATLEREPVRGGRKLAVATEDPYVCPRLHEAIELVGKRWTGAIIAALLTGGSMRFSQIGHAIPELSDRLLSERMKELESRGLVERRVSEDGPVRVEYELTDMGRELRAAMDELKDWAHRWL